MIIEGTVTIPNAERTKSVIQRTDLPELWVKHKPKSEEGASPGYFWCLQRWKRIGFLSVETERDLLTLGRKASPGQSRLDKEKQE